jgi:endogenous inhibitor of DNA gyrase (YacG/DUF329 family)
MPNQTILDFWNFVRFETDSLQFESWVYAETALESVVGAELHLRLLETNYRNESQVHELKSVLWNWIDSKNPKFAEETYGLKTIPWQSAPFYPVICQKCKKRFDEPDLGDFAYGLFILHTEDGKAYAYLQGLENSAWDSISESFEKVIGKKPAKYPNHSNYVDRLQWTIARCADSFHGQKLEIIPRRCPNCQSTSIDGSYIHSDYSREIPVVSFRKFLALDDIAKFQRVEELAIASTKTNLYS